MNVGSLCAGIGGIDRGLHTHGHNTSWVCEIDADPSTILAHRFPGVPNHGDITTVDWSTVEPVDILTAGYPCQPFSSAGQRKGTEDDRHLWPAVHTAIRDLRPRYVFLENVRGHLSLGFGDVLGDLAAIRYDADWGVFRASDIGAPHRRERVFIVARDTDLERRDRVSSPPVRRDEIHGQGRVDVDRQCYGYRPYFAPTTDASGQGREGSAVGRIQRIEPTEMGTRPRLGAYEPAVAHWENLHGLAPHPLDRTDPPRLNPAFAEWMMGYPAGWVTDLLGRRSALKAIGNAVVPHVAAYAWGQLTTRTEVAA